MNHGYDDNGSRVVIDWHSPVDDLEPVEAPACASIPVITVVERIAATFTQGDSKITTLAWRFILGDEPASMRRCALRAGVTVAAISRRARIIAESFGIPLRDPRRREQRRAITRHSWKRRRRAGFADPPPEQPTNCNEPTCTGGSHE